MNGYPQAPQPPVSPVNPPSLQVPEQNIKKPSYNWLKWVLIVVFVALLSSGATYLVLQSQNQPFLPAEVSTKAGPTPTPTPDETANWQNYQSGQNVNGIIINYPAGWKVNYRKEYNLGTDYKAKYRIAFDFAPSDWKEQGYGWMGWGILDFDVYDPQIDINQWISKYSPDSKNNLTVKEGLRIGDRIIDGAKVGGKSTFEIESNISQFGATVIFGSNYTYDLSHSQDGSDDFVKDENTKTGVFSFIQIK